tara:strand:+ start:3604 stop:4275 length:672 start_codon:yes stop_codon:yes gene_type:complete
MSIDNINFDHLLNNLEKTSFKNSIFNYEPGRRAFLSLGKGSVSKWLDTLLPNTRLILEPKIIGESIGIQYINGKINKAINKNSEDITEKINSQKSVPKCIFIKERIEIRGVLYEPKQNKTEPINIKINSQKRHKIKFCVFHIFHCKINHFQALQELKNLNFETPETQFTKFISDIELYRQYWKEEKLFQSYPTSGLVLKINSRKLQNQLGENNISRNWAYAIN